ncbi:dephospho-CoA kinase [Puniceicoccus vermicola]|uniref:Dephospho-CoA kinase n=1 Tax=Puniceicoccus vermicola TaxID=388746 RepID=A0A7X1E3G8_9BACT|nr:dephospho-CoA kinase [Puniceicoccus vermicola]MBC2600963.1 dephospho-CoA kinase [Puniceicoccus vermicola]
MHGIRLGLTGTIGSGKSTVLSLMAKQGWRGVRTDHLAREEMETPKAIAKIRDRWGSAVFDEEGVLDREAVAGIVFVNDEELNWLENLLHPLVRQRWMQRMEEDAENDVVVEIPLLFEKKLASHFDFVVSLNCPEPLQFERLRARGLSANDIEARKLRQLPASEKDSRADFVISNSGTISFLEKQVIRLSERIRGMANRKS